MKKLITRLLNEIYAVLKNTFKVSSLQSVIIFSFTAVTLLMLIFVSVALYSMFSKTAEKNTASSTQQILTQVTLNFENYLDEMMEISDLISTSLVSEPGSEAGAIENVLDLTKKVRKDIVSMAIYDKKGDLYLSSPAYDNDPNYVISTQDWFTGSLSWKNKYNFLPPHVQRLFEGKRPWVISLCRGASLSDENTSSDWVTVVDMNFSAIEQLCKRVSLGKRGYIYVIDQNGDLIYHPQQQIIYAGLKTENIDFALNKEDGSYYHDFMGERRIVTVNTIKYTNWKMVGISYVNELEATRRNISLFVVFISIFGLVFAILASLFISAKISEPIKNLEKQMKKVENGDFNISVDVRGEDEVRRLSKAFNVMIAKIRQLMAEIINEQEAKRKSELKALQAQINPHFLYNTLDSIVWMNENQRYDAVTPMVVALSQFFRISISKGNEFITVRDELEHVRSYLIIQKMRYRDKFDFTIDAEPDVLVLKTVKLILQPIVENAIYHGITPIQEKGLIQISAAIEGDDLLYRITDNGYGIKPEIVEMILNTTPGKKRGGVGLRNVNERIQLYFGPKYGIKITSILDEGTTVFIRIPLLPNGGENENSR